MNSNIGDCWLFQPAKVDQLCQGVILMMPVRSLCGGNGDCVASYILSKLKPLISAGSYGGRTCVQCDFHY